MDHHIRDLAMRPKGVSDLGLGVFSYTEDEAENDKENLALAASEEVRV